MRTKALLVIVPGIILGLSISFIAYRAGITHNDMMRYYLYIALTLIVVITAILLYRKQNFQKRYQEILPILIYEKDPARFITEMIRLVNKVYGFYTRNLYEISLATGYSANGDDERAYQILTTIDPRNLSEISQAIYYNNLFAIIYNLGDEASAITILEDNKELFKQYEDHPTLSGGLALNKVFRYLSEQDIECAKTHLEKAESLCSDPYLNDMVEYLKAKVLFHEENYEQSEISLRKLKDRRLTPSMLNKINRLEENLSVINS